jgi:DNA-directed RNA polymerase specialized sigma subunit
VADDITEYDEDVGYENYDEVLFNRWKQNPSKPNFQSLYRGFGGLINKASQKASYGSNLPRAAFKLQAAQEFYNAINTFDPEKGKLKTHLYGSIEKKLNRLNYKYANVGRIIERSGSDLGVYNVTQYQNAVESLRYKLNREPSAVEIAQEMGITVDKVDKFSKELRKDLSLNSDLENMVTFDEIAAVDDPIIQMHYYDMGPEEQNLFDYARGSHGKKKIAKPNGEPDWKEIARTMNISESKVNKLRQKIVKRVEEK